MHLYEELKEQRKGILVQLNKVETPISIFEVQNKIAQKIISSEQNFNVTGKREYKDHIYLLRAYADTLAWKFLHKHSIRQLKKNPSLPQSLLHQGDDFLFTLKKAGELANTGIIILIADITNCIKIGDLIACIDPEKPIIIECKNSYLTKKKLSSGRIKRQISRGIRTSEYLNKGKAKFYNEDNIRITIETNVKSEYNWDVINKVVHNAMREGKGVAKIDDFDLVLAINKDASIENLDDIKNTFKIPTIGLHTTIFEDSSLLVSPPSAWPIGLECQLH